MSVTSLLSHHLLLPLGIYYLVNGFLFGFRNKATLLLMSGAFLVDIDHLLADPIFDASRCSLGFHPLHRLPLIAAILIIPALLRWWPLVIGLLIHFGLDWLDCF